MSSSNHVQDQESIASSSDTVAKRKDRLASSTNSPSLSRILGVDSNPCDVTKVFRHIATLKEKDEPFNYFRKYANISLQDERLFELL